MGDRKLPTRKPFERKGNGYMKCPVCEHLHQHAPPNTKTNAQDMCFLRALILPEMKQQILDTAREEGISMSAFTRRVFGWYFAQRAQNLAQLPQTAEKKWSYNDE